MNNIENFQSLGSCKLWLPWLALIFGVFLFYIVTMTPGQRRGGDFAQYLSHAKNIATGVPYGDTGYIYNPQNPIIGPRAYPPIFSLFLAPTYKLFGLNLTAFKVQMIVIFCMALLITAKLFSLYLSHWAVSICLIIIGFSPLFWQWKDLILSEHLFLFLWYLAILLVDLRYIRGRIFLSERTHAALLGICIYLAYGTRSVGIALIPAVLACEFIHKKRITQFSLASVGISVALILLQRVLFPLAGSGYLEQLTQVSIESIMYNLYADIVSLASLWENGYSRTVRRIAGIIISLFAIVGFLTANRKRLNCLGAAMTFYFLVIILWPSSAWTRMILPLLPGYICFALVGIDVWQHPVMVRKYGPVALLVFAIVCFLGAYRTLEFERTDNWERREVMDLFNYLEKKTDKNDICLFYGPRVLALYTERNASAYPIVDKESDLWDYIESIGGSILVNRKAAGEYPERVLNGHKDLKELFQNNEFIVYTRR